MVSLAASCLRTFGACLLLFCVGSRGTLLFYDDLKSRPYNVSFDSRSFIIDGQRTLLLGGAVHYPRIPESEWLAVFKQMRANGLNHMQTYVFWNFHEPWFDWTEDAVSSDHKYNWQRGRGNLFKFVQLAGQAGLFVNVRISGFVCAEWENGGVPAWLNNVPGLRFRWYEERFMAEMKIFFEKTMEILEPLLAKNGGPIALLQVENEWPDPKEKDPEGKYIQWCGELAESFDAQVPWVMCNGAAANSTVSTYNGNDGEKDGFARSHFKERPNEPLAWTENEQWFGTWTGEGDWDDRAASEVAKSVANWFAVGAAHHVYYMWFGGNHIEHWAASGLTNAYADGALLHADTIPNEPKYSHLGTLHKILGDVQESMLASPLPNPAGVLVGCAGDKRAVMFEYTKGKTPVAFLLNKGSEKLSCTYRDQILEIQPDSTLIFSISDKKVIFDTHTDDTRVQREYTTVVDLNDATKWTFEQEALPSSERKHGVSASDGIRATSLLEHTVVSKGDSAYVWYSADLVVPDDSDLGQFMLSGAGEIVVEVEGRKSAAYYLVIDGKTVDGGWRSNAEKQEGGGGGALYSFKWNFSEEPEKEMRGEDLGEERLIRVDLLSVNLGVGNLIVPGVRTSGLDWKGAGAVRFRTADRDLLRDVSVLKGPEVWTHTVGLKGKSASEGNSTEAKGRDTPLTWATVSFEITREMAKSVELFEKVFVLDLGGEYLASRGSIFLDKHDLGKYWRYPCEPWVGEKEAEAKEAAQRYYYLPGEILAVPGKHTLTLFDEGGFALPAAGEGGESDMGGIRIALASLPQGMKEIRQTDSQTMGREDGNGMTLDFVSVFALRGASEATA